jgi:hypothetical protein
LIAPSLGRTQPPIDINLNDRNTAAIECSEAFSTIAEHFLTPAEVDLPLDGSPPSPRGTPEEIDHQERTSPEVKTTWERWRKEAHNRALASVPPMATALHDISTSQLPPVIADIGPPLPGGKYKNLAAHPAGNRRTPASFIGLQDYVRLQGGNSELCNEILILVDCLVF